MSNFWEVFAATAARAGDRTAIEVQRNEILERVGYSQLAARAEGVARWLGDAGIEPGDRCGILADNDAAWCAAYLGILRLGAVVVPLDTNYSAGRVATILADAGARALLAGPRLWDVAAEAVAGRADVLLAAVAGPFDAVPDAPLTPCPATWADPAVILYTSGTTADPKGVVLSHGNLDAERRAAFQVVDVNERDSVLGVLPLFHALAQVGNLLLPLALGARVVFLESVNTTEVLRALRDREISILVCVPQFFYLIHERVRGEVARDGMLARAAFAARLRVNRIARSHGPNLGPVLFRRVHAAMGPQMRLLVTGGSKFDPAIGAELYALGFTILQAYGLTETSGAATINRPDEAHLDTVGRALPGVELRVMPPEAGNTNGGDPLDGEVAIRGPIVMQGYFQRPDATREVMRDGWLLTGDLGRLDAQGRLTITGRRKEVIVLASGKNLHPDELEAHYRQSRYINEVCVLGVTGGDTHQSERLHAVIVPDQDRLRERRVVNTGELLRFEVEGLTALLPPHKRVLGYDIWMEPLPRTTTGELRRHEIARRLNASAEARGDERDRPLSHEDRAWLDDETRAAMVAAVASRARKGARVTPDAHLDLDLGLDSMERVELITELEQRFGTRFDAERGHEILTVRQLVDALRPQGGATGTHEVEEPWASLLSDLPPADHPVLSGLLERRWLYSPAGLIVVGLLRALLPRIEAEGLEHVPAGGAFIICPNHQSYLDPFVLGCVLPYRTLRQLFFVGATEYFSSPVMRRVARQLNLIPVDPDANLVPAMKAGAFGLVHGKILMLFPEGERSIDGGLKRFKKGAPILAQHVGVPILPVALGGVFELWPRNHSLSLRLMAPWSGHRLRITVGPPLTFSRDESSAEATARLREAIVAMFDAQGSHPDPGRT